MDRCYLVNFNLNSWMLFISELNYYPLNPFKIRDQAYLTFFFDKSDS